MITLTDAADITATSPPQPSSLTTHLQQVFAALSSKRSREDVPAAQLGHINRAMAVVDLFRQVSEGVGDDAWVDDFGAAACWLYRWYHEVERNEQTPLQTRQAATAVAGAWSKVVDALPAAVVNAVDYDRSNLGLIRILRLWTVATRALVSAVATSPSRQHAAAAMSLLDVVACEAAVMAMEWR